VDILKSEIDRHERQEELEIEMAARGDGGTAPVGGLQAGNAGNGDGAANASAAPPVDYATLPLSDPRSAINPRLETASDRYRKAFRGYLLGDGGRELRALQADIDVEGGYLVAPQQFVAQLLRNVDDAVHIRGLATKRTLANAESLGVPTLDTDVADADWTTEIQTGSEDASLRFGKRELRPHPLAKRIKESNKLLRSAAFNVEALVRERLAYKFAVTEEKAYITGDGFEKPLGLFTASADGISTAADIVAGTSTAITGDGLMDVKYALKPQYWRNARWFFHRDAIKMIRKLKTTDLQYIWQPGLQGGQPDVILDQPFIVNEFVPNTFTADLYVGILGDFSFYWIVDALSMQLQRLIELYAETNQVGFIGRLETDGMPVLEEAFKRVTLAS